MSTIVLSRTNSKYYPSIASVLAKEKVLYSTTTSPWFWAYTWNT